VNRHGAFAEYIAMPASNLWPIPDQIPSELAAFFDPYGNAAHCALEFDVIGEDVLITGAGPIGIIAAGICKHVGRAMSWSPTSTITGSSSPPTWARPAWSTSASSR
jgi:threonine dehydrogenase-like Zn-dependent dehydrogenase